jgi:hypothetical protein
MHVLLVCDTEKSIRVKMLYAESNPLAVKIQLIYCRETNIQFFNKFILTSPDFNHDFHFDRNIERQHIGP